MKKDERDSISSSECDIQPKGSASDKKNEIERAPMIQIVGLYR